MRRSRSLWRAPPAAHRLPAGAGVKALQQCSTSGSRAEHTRRNELILPRMRPQVRCTPGGRSRRSSPRVRKEGKKEINKEGKKEVLRENKIAFFRQIIPVVSVSTLLRKTTFLLVSGAKVPLSQSDAGLRPEEAAHWTAASLQPLPPRGAAREELSRHDEAASHEEDDATSGLCWSEKRLYCQTIYIPPFFF